MKMVSGRKRCGRAAKGASSCGGAARFASPLPKVGLRYSQLIGMSAIKNNTLRMTHAPTVLYSPAMLRVVTASAPHRFALLTLGSIWVLSSPLAAQQRAENGKAPVVAAEEQPHARSSEEPPKQPEGEQSESKASEGTGSGAEGPGDEQTGGEAGEQDEGSDVEASTTEKPGIQQMLAESIAESTDGEDEVDESAPLDEASDSVRSICDIDPAACIQQIGQITCAESISFSPNYGAKNSEQIVLPTQDMELGGEMVFVTSEGRVGAMGDQRSEIRFTDVGLLRLRGRRSFTDWMEIYLASSLLAKQPGEWHESIWQDAQGGVRLAFADHFAARLGGGGGPLFEERGYWWRGSPELQAKASASRLLRFDLGLGSTTTVVKGKANEGAFWLEELSVHAETQFGAGDGAFWVRLDYSVPLASGPDGTAPDPRSDRYVDPQMRLGLQVGGVLTVSSTGWDAYFAYSVVDRGEPERAETVLPILDEGFDQTQIVFGVQHRFDTDTCQRRQCGDCLD